MRLYKQTIQLGAELKGVDIVPKNPPPPPPPVFSEAEVAQREAAAREIATQQATERSNQEISQLRDQAVNLQEGVLTQIENKFNLMINDINSRIPNLVVALTQRVLAGHVMDVDTVKNIISEAVSEISSEKEEIEVSLAESDFQLMKLHGGDFVAQHPNMSFKKDSNLVPGDCLLASRFGLVDARLEKKLSKILGDAAGGNDS